MFKLILKRQSLVPYVTDGILGDLQQGKDREVYVIVVDKLTAIVNQGLGSFHPEESNKHR